MCSEIYTHLLRKVWRYKVVIRTDNKVVKKDKTTSTDLQNATQKTKDWATRTLGAAGKKPDQGLTTTVIFPSAVMSASSDFYSTPNEKILAISWREQVTFDEMIMLTARYWTNTLSWVFIVLEHWNKHLRIDMSLHSNTLSWFWTIKSFLYLLNAAFLTEKQQIPILYSLVCLDRCSNPHLLHWGRAC